MYKMAMGEKKTPKYIQGENKRKKSRLVDLPSPHLRKKMEADCFPVSENTENKLDLL